MINCGHDVDEIISCINIGMSENFKSKIKGMKNPYGDGKSSKRIVKILKEIDIDDELLTKAITY